MQSILTRISAREVARWANKPPRFLSPPLRSSCRLSGPSRGCPLALLSVLLSKSPLGFMFFLSPPRLSKSVQARSWAGFGTSRTWMGAGGIQDSTMLPDEIWFVVEKIKVGGVAGSGECVRGHNLDRFGYWAGLRRARCTHLGDPFQLR